MSPLPGMPEMLPLLPCALACTQTHIDVQVGAFAAKVPEALRNTCQALGAASALRRIDGDTVLMRDIYPVTVLVGYQFILRWTNAHAMWLKRLSPLSTRILETLMTMPLNHPRLKEDIIGKVSRTAGPKTITLSHVQLFFLMQVFSRLSAWP